MARKLITLNNFAPLPKRFLISLALSLILHGLIMISFGMPSYPTYGNKVLEVQLKSLPFARGQSIFGATQASAPSASALPFASLVIPSQIHQQKLDNQLQAKTVAASPIANSRLTDKNILQTLSPTSQAATPLKSDQKPLLPISDQTVLANNVDIEYEIFVGENRKPLGTAKQHYESDINGNYQIRYQNVPNESQSSWQLEINGSILKKGLSPSNYTRQGKLAKDLLAVSVGSDESSEPDTTVQEGNMPDGILDRLSMLYQFMHAHPDNTEGKLWLTDGEKIGEYDYHVLGYEPVAIRSQGLVNTVHIKLTNKDNPEVTELWLATDHLYLPVKIRRLDNHGTSTEQVAISLNIK